MASSTRFAGHNFKSDCYSIDFSQNGEKSYFVSSFADKTVKIWDLNQILNDGNKLESPSLVIKDAIELAPVEVKIDS